MPLEARPERVFPKLMTENGAAAIDARTCTVYYRRYQYGPMIEVARQ